MSKTKLTQPPATADPTARLVDMAFADLDTVEAWMRRFPHLTVTRYENSIIARHEDGFTAGFGPLQPLDAGIALAFAVLGPYWMFVVPKLIDKIHKELKRRKIDADQT
jgi:hypothetical protein